MKCDSLVATIDIVSDSDRDEDADCHDDMLAIQDIQHDALVPVSVDERAMCMLADKVGSLNAEKRTMKRAIDRKDKKIGKLTDENKRLKSDLKAATKSSSSSASAVSSRSHGANSQKLVAVKDIAMPNSRSRSDAMMVAVDSQLSQSPSDGLFPILEIDPSCGMASRITIM